MNRPATASQSLGNPERKNTPCISDLAVVKFFLKKERVFFFRGSAQEVSGQCVGLQYGLGQAKNYFFWGNGCFFFCCWRCGLRGRGGGGGGRGGGGGDSELPNFFRRRFSCQ